MWYTDRFRPGEHFVEFGDTYVDFAEALAWARTHPTECEAMVRATRSEWLRTFGTWEPSIQVTLEAVARFGWEHTGTTATPSSSGSAYRSAPVVTEPVAGAALRSSAARGNASAG
jgi:hypothetical protein